MAETLVVPWIRESEPRQLGFPGSRKPREPDPPEGFKFNDKNRQLVPVDKWGRPIENFPGLSFGQKRRVARFWAELKTYEHELEAYRTTQEALGLKPDL